MKLIKLSILLLCIFSSCGLNQRDEKIKAKELEINKKRQELLLWEQELTQKETHLKEREFRLDSTKKEIDSVIVHGPNVAGKWLVNMQCVETSCEGSAIGDLKTEQWEFTINNNEIVAKAYAGKNLSRIYNGAYTQSGMQLIDKSANNGAKMDVTLRILSSEKMDGIREIRLPGCKTIYSITAERL